MNVGKRDICSDLLKILACFLVIVNHTSITFGNFHGQITASWVLSVIIFYFSKMAVPIFLMISGMFLLGKERDYQYSFKKAGHFTVILLFWNYLYWIAQVGVAKFWRLDQYLFSTIQRASSIHLWYLYTLIGFYLLLPFLSKLVIHFTKKDFRIFLLLWLIFGSIVPFLISNFGFPTPFSYFQIGLFTGFLGYFILGAYLKKYPLKRSTGFILFILGLTVATILTIVLSYKTGKVYMNLDNVIQLPIVCLSIGFYSIIRTFDFSKFSAQRTGQIISSISSLTLGVYVMHIFVIRKVSIIPVFQSILNQPGIVVLAAYLVFDVVIMFISLGITKVMTMIPILKKVVN